MRPPHTHPKTQTPFLPLAAALTPNQKTEELDLHSLEVQRAI